MKIGLIAFQNAINYGAVLQMYALKSKLEEMGHHPQIINYISPTVKEGNQLQRVPYVPKNSKLRNLKRMYLSFSYFRTQKDWEKKFNEFKIFRDKYLELEEEFHDNSFIRKYSNIEAIIVGSDQIWNPNITKGFDPVYFCSFDRNDIKKIAYAASCGSVNTLENKHEEFFSLIENFDNISTREKELSNFINKTHDAQTVLDPTLLLDVSRYNEITTVPNEENYLLIYKMQYNKELYKIAMQVAKEKKLSIIELGFEPVIKNQNIKYIPSTSPNEFLGYFKKASFIITNSFHGTAFSIKYNKSFLTVPHRSVGERMTNLLENLELESNIIRSSDEFNVEHLKKIDYINVNEILNREIENSIKYLTNALS